MADIESQLQSTIGTALTWEGKGLHSGAHCSVTVHPAEENFGIKFSRIVGEKKHFLPTDHRFVTATNRCTNIGNDHIQVGTVEHLLAAAKGAGVTNLEIVVDGPEIPILDGSAEGFYTTFTANKVEQQSNRQLPVTIEEVLEFTDEKSGSSYTVVPAEQFSVEVILDYDNDHIGRQYASYQSGDDFGQLANARTFVLVTELEALCKADLIKGGDLSNAVVVPSGSESRQMLSNVLESLGRPVDEEVLIEFDKGVQLRYPDELARHKILDLIGDLSLLGCDLNCKIIARRPGHTGNAALVGYLKPIVQKAIRLKGKPRYNPNTPPIYSSVEIQGFLPHRYPFLLVDKIIELSDTHVVGVKNITFNEQLFQGHFPGNPVFPGVLQMEALAQTGGILALNTVDLPSNWDTYFLKMDNVKFKNMVHPGDTLILKMELLTPIRRGIVHMQGTAYVGEKIVSEGELVARIVDRTKI